MTEKRRRPVEVTDAPEHRSIPIDTFDLEDSSEDTLVIKGYASTFQPYEMYGGPSNGYGWIEQIDRGAFERTLKESPDLHLLINHEGLPLARTKSGNLDLSVDNHGLHVVARLDRSDPDVQRLEPKMRRGDMDEMSFAFRVKGQKWESTPEFKDDPEALRTITEVSLHKGDVSVVNFGANPTTSVSIDRALAALATCDKRELAELRDGMRESTVRGALEALEALAAKPEVSEEKDERSEGVAGPTGTLLDGALIDIANLRGIPMVGSMVASNLADALRAYAEDEVTSLIKALDATLDEAVDLSGDADRQSLPEPVAQALDLLLAAQTIAGNLMKATNTFDPDAPDNDDDRANADEAETREGAEAVEKRESVSDHAWDFPQSAYTPEQWRHACLIDSGTGDADAKSRYHLPVREPDGTLNRNGVHAAAGRLDQVSGISDEQRTVAAKRLVALYRDQLHEDPPAHLLDMAHERSLDVHVTAVVPDTALAGLLARVEAMDAMFRKITGADGAPEERDDEEERDEAPKGLTLRELRALEGIVPNEGPLTLAELRALEAS